MSVVQIYDQGNIFPPSVLDIEEKTLIDQFLTGIKTIAAISLALHYPTLASVSHSLVNSYKNILGVSLATDYTFWGSEKVRSETPFLDHIGCSDTHTFSPILFRQAKAYLENPEAFAVAAPAAAEAAAPAAAEAKEEEKKEEEEEEDDDMGFGLFD